jgi:hypothetical protein
MARQRSLDRAHAPDASATRLDATPDAELPAAVVEGWRPGGGGGDACSATCTAAVALWVATVRARAGAVRRPSRFPMEIHFVWGFSMGAQGA